MNLSNCNWNLAHVTWWISTMYYSFIVYLSRSYLYLLWVNHPIFVHECSYIEYAQALLSVHRSPASVFAVPVHATTLKLTTSISWPPSAFSLLYMILRIYKTPYQWNNIRQRCQYTKLVNWQKSSYFHFDFSNQRINSYSDPLVLSTGG